MAIALSNSLTKTDNNRLKLVKLKSSNKMQQPLHIYDNQDRARILGERLSRILDKQLVFDAVEGYTWSSYLIKTKFENSKNYLWDKCQYFSQASYSFYVDMFVNNASFRVGGQLFAVKEDQVRFVYFSLVHALFEVLINLLKTNTPYCSTVRLVMLILQQIISCFYMRFLLKTRLQILGICFKD
jgi:hypothetical protein